jgi:hypothetical protein
MLCLAVLIILSRLSHEDQNEKKYDYRNNDYEYRTATCGRF